MLFVVDRMATFLGDLSTKYRSECVVYDSVLILEIKTATVAWKRLELFFNTTGRPRQGGWPGGAKMYSFHVVRQGGGGGNDLRFTTSFSCCKFFKCLKFGKTV
uniref:Uncharacterized protein n=1 Tax=Romanomermis culicivorax TaxID=13658 RepID=A0A915K4E4_ROMCU